MPVISTSYGPVFFRRPDIGQNPMAQEPRTIAIPSRAARDGGLLDWAAATPEPCSVGRKLLLTSLINKSRLESMKLQQPDGFPLTFNLPDAATLTGGSVSNLRNYVARDILKHVGQIPFAGQERRFTVTGLVEVAI